LCEVRLVFFGVDAIDRASIHASRIFRSNTGFRYNVCHFCNTLNDTEIAQQAVFLNRVSLNGFLRCLEGWKQRVNGASCYR
jgi:hypothetical protein